MMTIGSTNQCIFYVYVVHYYYYTTMVTQSYESKLYGYLRSPLVRIGLELATAYFILPSVPELARYSPLTLSLGTVAATEAIVVYSGAFGHQKY